MRTNKHIRLFLTMVCAVVMTMATACSSPKKLTTDTATYNASSSILAGLGINYPKWETAELSGKLKLKSLPLSPTIKIYMQNREVLILSARAPLVGEAVRVELDRDSLLIVNKLNNTYCLESADKLQEIYPSLCGEVQSLLLGRVVIPSKGELSEDNVLLADIETLANGTKKISPKLENFPVDVIMDYILTPDGKLKNLGLAMDTKKLFSLDYNWKGNDGCDMKATVTKKGAPYVVELNLDAPKFGITMPDRYKLKPGKLTRRKLKEMLSFISFK